MLPDAPYLRAVVDEIEDTYREFGSGAAWGKFVSFVMYDGPVTEAGVPPATWPPESQGGAGDDSGAGEPPPAPSEKDQADTELFFLRMLKPFTRYEPDLDALGSGRPRVVVAVGATSRDEAAARSTRALAERLGTLATSFPGDHGGFMADPAGFDQAIRQVLAQAR